MASYMAAVRMRDWKSGVIIRRFGKTYNQSGGVTQHSKQEYRGQIRFRAVLSVRQPTRGSL